MKQNLHVTCKLKTDMNIIIGIQLWNEEQTAINSGTNYVSKYETECNRWMVMSGNNYEKQDLNFQKLMWIR